ncbi:MOSC domain protein [Aspergillus nomiae NRRL 13137]|uniref:MOSC domain protein n=1 Tax=Aspergillus nomiae NRRL (strain ATCC 15546 / NRRL 13137 / CBS 260.88 / M93) TaxID=1509407 RepID=A0A0L1J3Z1_ASPN3|nr:MOSC domain protein [Aspergillus nomiae NRRL 13137]KNG86459.1 MOSC domain protein [Aspergillus nomiae NRRL 13137]
MLNPTEPILGFNTVRHYAMNTFSTLAIIWLPLIPIAIFFISHKYYQFTSPPPKGCRKLGLPHHKTNLHDEYDPKYSQGVPEKHTDPEDQPSWRIKALFAYPIKSCAGIELDTADVVPTGFTYDRQFCFAEYTTPKTSNNNRSEQAHWTARTLRDGSLCRMALIRPEIWVPDPTADDYSRELQEVRSQGVLVIHYPRVADGMLSLPVKLGMKLGLLSKELSFRVPFSPPQDGSSETTYPSTPVKIWKDTPLAHDYGCHLPPSLRRFLDPDRVRGPLTLFRVNPSHHREIFRNAPRKEHLGFQPVTGFADAYPIHLLSIASVQDIASKCKADIPELSIRRFRANIIVQGPGAYEEDHWKRVRIGNSGSGSGSGGVEVYTACRTIRCKLPNVDPDTGVRHPVEPDRSLKRWRRIDRGDLTNAALGMQVVPAVREFRVCVGDGIEVLETGEHCYIKMLKPGEKVEGV